MTGRPGTRRLFVAVLVTVIGVTGCRPEAAPETASTSGIPASVPPAAADAVRATIDAVNAGAGGSAADQQQLLASLVDPDHRAEVVGCPTATTTVRFEPIYPGLRALDVESDSYALPTLIRIFRGDRAAGTDLTTLQLVIRPAAGGNEAFLTPFCVN